jgi:hypothetical protein
MKRSPYLPLSFSSIKEFAKSPNHFLAYKNKQKETTAAMTRGSAVHTFVLEPDEFESRYLVAPDIRRGTLAWKEVESAAGEREILKDSEFEVIENMAAALYQHPAAAQLFARKTAVEQAVEFTFNGLPFRGFIDEVGDTFVADLKTTQDVSPREFQRWVFGNKYHWQAALYCKATGLDEFYFIGVEAARPHNVMVYLMDKTSIELGIFELIQITERFKQWDGMPATYDNDVNVLMPPKWLTLPND